MIITTWIASLPTSCHTRSAANRSISTARLPRNSCCISPHWVAPCMSGAIGKKVIGLADPLVTISSGAAMRWPLVTSMPPPRAKKTSSWRQTTPLGRPVVPPVKSR